MLHLTVFTCEWWATLASVAVDSIYTNAVIFTGSRCTFIYVLLTIHTSESRLALAHVVIMSVYTGATILAWTWLTLILFLFTVVSFPASLTLTTIPILLFNTFSVHTRLKSAVVSPRDAQKAVGVGRAQAVKPIDLVHTGSPTHTWV